MNDLCHLTGYTRHQLRGLLDLALPRGVSKGARIPREFRSQELIHVVAMVELETQFGIKRSHVAAVAAQLGQALSGPKTQTHEARLIVAFTPPQVTYAAELIPARDGIVMSLAPLFWKIDQYVGLAVSMSTQDQLRLGPAMLRTAGRRESS